MISCMNIASKLTTSFVLQFDYYYFTKHQKILFSANYYGKPYGIWLFDNGTFENYGIGGDENWEFYGNFRREGEPIKLFRNPWTLGLTRHYGSPRRVVFEKRT